MKRTLLTFCAIIGASAVGAAAASTATPSPPPKKDACAAKASKWGRAQCETYTHAAPGDEYFGRMKLSYLGINNTFRDESIRAGASTTDSNIINKVNFADDALRAWMRKYPNDPQLARSFYLATEVFKKIYTQDTQDRAWHYMQLEVRQFPSTYFGKTVKKNMTIGYTEHYYAPAQMCPTPVPSGAPSASESPVASSAPTSSPAPGHPKIDIIVPPCIVPTPEPTATPSAPPSASSQPSPSPTHLP